MKRQCKIDLDYHVLREIKHEGIDVDKKLDLERIKHIYI